MKKRITSLFVAFAMIFTMLPGMALTVAAEDYDLWVGGVGLNSSNGWTTTDGTSGTATYDPATKTLTLDNFQFNGEGHEYAGKVAAIYSEQPLNIILTGSNSVNMIPTEGKENNIIYCEGDLSFSGDDDDEELDDILDVNFSPILDPTGNPVGGDTTGGCDNAAIRSGGSVSVSGSCAIMFYGTGSTVASYGIYSSGNISFSGNCHLVGSSSKAAAKSYIVYSSGAIEASDNAYLYFSMNNDSAEDKGNYICGMYSKGNVTIGDSAYLSIMTNDGAETNHGMYSEGNVTIGGARVECSGGAAGLYSEHKVTFDDDTSNDNTSNDNTYNPRFFVGEAENGYGIYAKDGIIINGGDNVTAQGGSQAFNVKPQIVERNDNNIWELQCGDDGYNQTNMPIEELAEAYQRNWVSITLTRPVASAEVLYISEAYNKLQLVLNNDNMQALQAAVDDCEAGYNGKTFSEILENMTSTDKKALAIEMGNTMLAVQACEKVKEVYEQALSLLQGETVEAISTAYIALRDALGSGQPDVLQEAVDGLEPLWDSFLHLDNEQLAELVVSLGLEDIKTGEDAYTSISSDWSAANIVVNMYELYQAYLDEPNESTASSFMGSYEGYFNDPNETNTLALISRFIGDIDEVYQQARADMQGKGSDSDYDMWYWMLMMMVNQEYKITASASEGGTITSAGVSKVKYDKSITYTITPAEGYAISAVLVNGENIGAVSEYTFKHVKKAQTIEVVFEKVKQQLPFTDVSENDWFYEDVKYVYENGLMLGTDAEGTSFSPNETLTRAMLVTILWRAAGQPIADGTADFSDVPANEWYSGAIAWAAANGIVLGYGDGTFGTNDEITREQLAAILYRYEQHLGGGFTGMWMFRMDYADLADVSDWAYEATCWLTMKEIYVCREEGELDPKAEAARAETAAFLHRYCEYRNGQQ